jgi:rod shape-determining protein MreC
MNLYNTGENRQKLVLNTLVAIICIVHYFNRDFQKDEVSVFEGLMIEVLSPLQKGITNINSQIDGFWGHYLANINASRDNESLRQELSKMELRLNELENLRGENVRLKSLLSYRAPENHQKVYARIVARDANSDFFVVRLNKGLAHGIKLQSPVVTSKGLVGHVYRLTQNYADVLTILDQNNRVDGIIERLRSHGIIEGLGNGRCSMKYVNRTAPIVLNDVVKTSGLGLIYPKGINIGPVVRIQRESYGVTQDLTVSPSVDFETLEEVVILVSQSDVDIEKEWSALNTTETGR